MKNKIIDFFKGFGVGISNLIPGFSGGTAAVILGVYDRFVTMFGDLFSNFKQTFKQCWAFLIGMVIGVIVGILAISELIGLFPVQTAFFITGLVIASYPGVIKLIKESGKINIISIICFVIFASIIVILPFLNKNVDNETFYWYVPLILFALGALCAAAMVVPGLSGALILMIFGYFFFVMAHIKSLIIELVKFTFNGYWISLLCIGAFGIGIIIGLVAISKFLKKALEKWPVVVYMSILGILVASPFAVFWLIYTNEDYIDKISSTGALGYIIASIMFIVGIVLVYVIPTVLSKKNQKEEENIE
ncbi:MAG: DUF368 domain-containing protein [Bacilli bacterium]|nr:DUF368 domain-containing protein [Bacilli bacterium]